MENFYENDIRYVEAQKRVKKLKEVLHSCDGLCVGEFVSHRKKCSTRRFSL